MNFYGLCCRMKGIKEYMSVNSEQEGDAKNVCFVYHDIYNSLVPYDEYFRYLVGVQVVSVS